MRLSLLGTLCLALLTPVAPVSASGPEPPTSPVRTASAQRVPGLVATRQVRGLTIPWDVQPIGGGRLLITERGGRLLLREGGTTSRVDFPSDRVWASGETGLMSMEIDPRFGRNGRFYTCQGWVKTDGGHDVRVIAWHLNDAGTRARLVETLLAGFPTSSGRHGGCRLLILRSGALLVGTGDAAIGQTPRDLTSLGGKTLRMNRMTGRPWRENPFINAGNRNRRYVHTYGHRNIQGLAQRSDGSLWNAEHGPGVEDEVNRLVNGGDYGWHPVPGYNESVPMTDHSLPGAQVGARWDSGPTPATSGAVFVRGKEWGAYQGSLAVACLEGNRVIFMKFGAAGSLRWTRAPDALRRFGRLRSVTLAPNNDLLITTANGSDDAIVRVRPR
ncbi:MAG TPA: PQQ-dependent sugar dehydrogenase [Nocardioides sp.]|nr:PQQ-dependent sugar dehydrogenase [Nocardioides sp.]